MVGHELRLSDHDFGELALQSRRNAGMDLPASTTQQGAIGCVLHQRVLEGVLCIGRGAPLEDQFGAYEPRQGPVHLLLRDGRDGADQLM